MTNSIFERLRPRGRRSSETRSSQPRIHRHFPPRISERHPIVLHGFALGSSDSLMGTSYGPGLGRDCPVRDGFNRASRGRSSRGRRSAQNHRNSRGTGDETEVDHEDQPNEEDINRFDRAARNAQAAIEAAIENARPREVRAGRRGTLMTWRAFHRKYLKSPDFSQIRERANESCAICSMGYSVEEGISPVQLACNGQHVICLDCAGNWFTKCRSRAYFAPKHTNACPMCRQVLFKHEESRERVTPLEDGRTIPGLLGQGVDTPSGLAFHNVLRDILRETYDRFISSDQ